MIPDINIFMADDINQVIEYLQDERDLPLVGDFKEFSTKILFFFEIFGLKYKRKIIKQFIAYFVFEFIKPYFDYV